MQPEHLAHRSELTAAQHLLQTRSESLEPEVVNESLGPWQSDARRIGIYLPGVHVQRHRYLPAIALLNRGKNARRRRHPQSPAAAEWKILTQSPLHHRREFKKFAVRGRSRVRLT